MSSKTFTPKLGDKWTTYLKQSMMYLYRDGECTFFRENRSGESPSRRQPGETDLPTPDAHAQLREWGYEVSGDQPAGNEQPLTESSVREIARAAVEELVKPHFDKFDEDYDRRCDSLAVRMDNMDHAIASLRSLQEILSKEVDELQRAKSQPTPAEVREAAPEPDWKGLLANLVEAVESANEADSQAASWFVLLGSAALAAAREHLARTNGGGK